MRKKNYEGILEELWSDNDNGNIKLYVTYRLLQEREQMPELFTYGDYHPLVAEGKNRNHLFGFIRKYKSQAYMVMLPMHLASAGFENILNIDWKDTCLTSKESISGTWKNIFDNKLVEINDKYMAGEIFLPFPLAVLKLE
jgi:maltooligosyltrehalose synthase